MRNAICYDDTGRDSWSNTLNPKMEVERRDVDLALGNGTVSYEHSAAATWNARILLITLAS